MTKAAIELLAPPAVTVGFWALSRLLLRLQREKAKAMTWPQFWLLLIAAYAMLAVALWGGGFFSGARESDSSPQLVQ